MLSICLWSSSSLWLSPLAGKTPILWWRCWAGEVALWLVLLSPQGWRFSRPLCLSLNRRRRAFTLQGSRPVGACTGSHLSCVAAFWTAGWSDVNKLMPVNTLVVPKHETKWSCLVGMSGLYVHLVGKKVWETGSELLYTLCNKCIHQTVKQ